MKENQHTEWKQSWSDEYLRWICGFANAQGGVLEIGRNDAGVAVGVSDAERLLVDIPNKARDILGVMVDAHLLVEDGKELVQVRVDAYPSPVSHKGEYHYRSGSTKQELKGAALDRFLLKRQGKHWDGVPVPRVGVADLEAKVLSDFRRQAMRSERLTQEVLSETDAVLLDKLHLMDGQYLKRAALMLFHLDPERFVTGAYIKIGFFESNSDLRYQDEVHGALLSQVTQALAVLKAKYLKALISYDGLQRVETYPVPDAALREAILNAVVHKDYASGAPIQISVYADKLMIWNPGQLPVNWTAARLLEKHSSVPFNPDIANTFFRAGMIESWGRGIERIIDACHLSGVEEPSFKDEQSGLWVTFAMQRSEHIQADTDQVRDQVRDQVNHAMKYLLAAMGVETLEALEIQTRLDYKNRTKFRNNYLQPALDKGLIEMTLPEKPQSRLQKYFLTAAGKTALIQFQSPKNTSKIEVAATPITTPITTPIEAHKQLLKLIRKNPSATTQELALGCSVSKDGVKYHLQKMKVLGLIRRLGSTRSGYWEILK